MAPIDGEPEKGLVLRLARLDGGELVLDGGLALVFFSIDPSSVGTGAYDALAGLGAPDRIETADIVALNTTMRARSAHASWTDLVGRELGWLGEIPPDLDLIDTDDRAWAAAGGDELVGTAIRSTVGRGRGVSVATKLLHLKRPRLFPILDALVAQILGRPITAEDLDGRTAQGSQLVLHLRAEGQRNARPLRAIRDQLAGRGFDRSLVRILDAVLWLAHPAAGGPGARRRFTVELLP